MRMHEIEPSAGSCYRKVHPTITALMPRISVRASTAAAKEQVESSKTKNFHLPEVEFDGRSGAVWFSQRENQGIQR
ncbi:hypothetical protein BJX63DRAFT_379260 [Aspergillus granulosus]|uniref:Uncharacterized protein n=1 Tax=Aspergillus granulosus TaxID=176169 RepID=A0ABR4I014_9EURO